MLFDSWDNLLRVIIVGVLAYASLVISLRVSGNRTLSKMNAFDLVVSVALGSTLATVMLSKDVALAEGVLAYILLISLQYCVSWLSVRAHWIRQITTGEPQILLYRGELLPAALRKARLTEDEVRAAIRSAGIDSLDMVRAAVLETNGSVSVVRQSDVGNGSSLAGVKGIEKMRSPNSN